MGFVPYVGFATHRRATVRIHLYFMRLMLMKCFVKKKNWVVIANGIRAVCSRVCYESGNLGLC
jgi:hypothetical protein